MGAAKIKCDAPVKRHGARSAAGAGAFGRGSAHACELRRPSCAALGNASMRSCHCERRAHRMCRVGDVKAFR
ncbi:hypothetical protein WT60_10355 [Burkholderia sp. MSMB617WGS]|nr:hypothetical protein WT60_10355 [Burkholderia sp. MSMB617WGS]